MKTTHVALLLGSLFLIPAGTTHAAEHPTNQVNRRLRRQHRRIRQGVRSGELTKGEAKNLREEDRSVRQEERDMRKGNGGKLTPDDRRALNQQENKVSRDIYNEKHDGETAK